MKSFRCLFLTGIVALPIVLSAQNVPNAGFENWTSGNPDSWGTTNIPILAVTVTQSSTAHSGSSCLQGTVVEYMSTPYPPFLYSGFPVTGSYGTLAGWYQYTPVGGDSLEIVLVAYKDGGAIGSGELATGVATSGWTQLALPIDYFFAGPADSVYIIVSIVASADVHTGSTFLLDDLQLTNPTGTPGIGTTPISFALQQNFPNPFNPSTTIAFEAPTRSSVRITLLNILGQEVGQIMAGEVDAGFTSMQWTANVPSGVYFYRLDARAADDPSRTFTQTRRMVILK